MVVTILVSFSLVSQRAFAEDYKIYISIQNENNVNTKTGLSVKTENDKVETTEKLNDDPEKIKETITGQPRDKVKVYLEESDDNSKYCQSKNYQTITTIWSNLN